MPALTIRDFIKDHSSIRNGRHGGVRRKTAILNLCGIDDDVGFLGWQTMRQTLTSTVFILVIDGNPTLSVLFM